MQNKQTPEELLQTPPSLNERSHMQQTPDDCFFFYIRHMASRLSDAIIEKFTVAMCWWHWWCVAMSVDRTVKAVMFGNITCSCQTVLKRNIKQPCWKRQVSALSINKSVENVLFPVIGINKTESKGTKGFLSFPFCVLACRCSVWLKALSCCGVCQLSGAWSRPAGVYIIFCWSFYQHSEVKNLCGVDFAVLFRVSPPAFSHDPHGMVLRNQIYCDFF